MAYYKGPILRRYAQQHKFEPRPPARPLSPLPELHELHPPRKPVERVAQIPEQMAGERLVRDEETASRSRRQSESNGSEKRKNKKDSSEAPPPLKRLKKRGGVRRHSCLTLSVLLLSLFMLGGLLATGLYLTETNILGPLSQFFHPINGKTSGSINGRPWNLLLLGSDNDRKFTFPNLLTQVMMVIHVNPFNNNVSMVSIPRDSWVAVPDQGMHKIDQAFLLGAGLRNNFDDGVRLARATIEHDYGIPIDRYAWVGLDGFSRVIDTLGGVDIDITHPVVDDNYPDDTSKKGVHKTNPYALKRLYLAPGAQHLSGAQALEYVRSRHADLVGDIGRTIRQQEVLQALKKKLAINTIFSHLPELFHDLTGKAYSDLSQQEMFSMANFARTLPARSISRLTLGPGQGSQNYGTLSWTGDPDPDQNQDIVLPNCDTIQPAVNRVFELGDAQSCQVNGNG
ncbi:MAG TPA: LCP family protein [Ktedonobacteraceae bacterium]